MNAKKKNSNKKLKNKIISFLKKNAIPNVMAVQIKINVNNALLHIKMYLLEILIIIVIAMLDIMQIH